MIITTSCTSESETRVVMSQDDLVAATTTVH